jgi:hypothetical protein
MIKQFSDKFAPVIQKLKLDSTITPYAFRHSSIVRHLMKGTPIRLVASSHDTSVAEIERTYSRYIVDKNTEGQLREALLDITTPEPNVLNYSRK